MARQAEIIITREIIDRNMVITATRNYKLEDNQLVCVVTVPEAYFARTMTIFHADDMARWVKVLRQIMVNDCGYLRHLALEGLQKEINDL